MQNGTDEPDTEEDEAEELDWDVEPPSQEYPFIGDVPIPEKRRAWVLLWLWEFGKPQMKADELIGEASKIERFLAGEAGQVVSLRTQ